MSKSYYCKRLNETLNFDALKIFHCCATRTGPGIDIPNPNNVNEIFNKKKSLIEMLNKGIVPTECQGCFDLEEKEPEKFNLLKCFQKPPKTSLIIVKHFKQCDCSCIYCCEKYLSERKIVLKSKKSDYYDLLPIIQKLYEKDLIDREKLDVHFQGGNVSVLDEFEDLLNLFYKNGVKRVEIATNGIKYLPVIEKFCNNTFVDVNISIDCGTRETYKKIKTVDKFDELVSNLKQYQKLPILLRLKYILVRGVNDNVHELTKYIELMKDIGIKNSELMIDQCDSGFVEGKEFEIPSHYYELFDLYKTKCKEYNIEANIWDYIEKILAQGSFFK